MSRKARQIYTREFYHIISRGNDRQKLFRNKNDFQFYLEQLARYKEKFRVSIFHYCLMSNHIHALMRCEDSETGITKMMHGLQTVYAGYFKKKYDKTGHVFEDRFKHFHIESDSYLLECGRYIERNPVRAQIVDDPGGYEWSSYRRYAYGEENFLITENILYAGLGIEAESRQKAYQDYVEPVRAYEVLVDRYFKERIQI
jgi:putative transposase